MEVLSREVIWPQGEDHPNRQRGEFTSTEFERYLREEGIKHKYTIPKTPQQNGVSKQMNHTLVKAVRSMLVDAELPHRFWAEALSTAAYLVNRSPTKALGDKTPFEAWYGKKPSVEHLKVFGCIAYSHVAKDERKKLDPKAKKCIFLGYTAQSKGYCLYDSEKLSVIFSRDIVFNESSTGIETEQEEKRLIQVETFPEEESEREENSDQDRTPDEDEAESHPEGEIDQVPQRKSTREVKRPDYYGAQVYAAAELQSEPESVEEALFSAEKEKWKAAMQKEMESIYSNDVWDLVELPKDCKTVGSKWVFKRKTYADGSIDRYKARLVAQGFSQRCGRDYDETFSPVIRFESLRTLIALAVQKGIQLHQLDITAAFLNGELEEKVFMRQPEGFVEDGKEHLVCKLKHSLYGLKQSPRCWNHTLDTHLKSMGFVQSPSDPCIYTSSEGETCLIGVYVDDMELAGQSLKRIQEVKKALSLRFDVKDLGELNYFLGVQVRQNHNNGDVWIGQPTFTESILKNYGMEDAKPVKTPVNVNSKLMKATEDSEFIDKCLYQSAVGSLLYLSTRTRPDIAFVVNNVARFCKSKKQSCIALSTAEAEYMALSSAAQEAVWMRELNSDLRNHSTEPTLIFEDNQSAICMAKNPQFYGRSKHINIKFHFIREQVGANTIQLKYTVPQQAC